MNTNGFTVKSEAAFDALIENLSDDALDHVVGGYIGETEKNRS